MGKILIEALQQVFGKGRSVIWCGHDRGGRIGHRLIVDAEASHNIQSAIIMDIVPTTEQWKVFSNPAASKAYYHWPLLAIPAAPLLIESMGPGTFVKHSLERAKGGNEAGTARFRENDAVAHYCHQFTSSECIAGSCGDYAAGATEDVEEQEKDQKEDRKVKIPLLVVYSASNLGRMHDVPKVWKDWVDGNFECEGISDGFGHYLPEEVPDRINKLVADWIHKQGK